MTNASRSPDLAGRRAAEHWFLRQGLPYVLRPGRLVRRVWSRSAPALAAFAVLMASSIVIVAVTGEHTIDIDGSPTRTEWFVLAFIVLVLPIAALGGWLVSRIEDIRLRRLASAASVVVAGMGALFGGPSARVMIDVGLDVVVITAILLCTATGVGAILGWALRMTWENLASIGGLLVRALPILLLTILVFFNGPAWSMAASVGRGRLWLALSFLILIAAAFLVSATLARAQPLLRPEAKKETLPADALARTPFAALPDRPRRVPLSQAERVNVVFVLASTQLVQVLTVAIATGLIFLVFGLIVVSPELLDTLTHGSPGDGQVLGMTLPIPNALIQLVMFLTVLTFMYVSARAVSDKEYRVQFVDPLLDQLRLTLVARDRYRTVTADRGAP